MPRVQTDDQPSGTDSPEPATPTDIALRHPTLEDGAHMWRIARDSGSLDLNTSYAYLLFARDFADSCLVAVIDGEVGGFVLGYRRPAEPETLFVWQIAVDPSHRGHGLAARLLDAVASGARHVEATITADNTASQRLFTSFARRHGADLVCALLLATHHFPDEHDAEGLVRIGPLRPTDI